MGVVLAGGRSERMGTDKATLRLEEGGPTLACHAYDKLSQVCSQVLTADGGRRCAPGSIVDGPGRGPAAGILGASRVAPGCPLLVLACDLPQVPSGLLQALASGRADWLVPTWQGHVEPLCSLWGPAALQCLAAAVGRGRYALWQLTRHPSLKVAWLAESDLRQWGDPAELFLNLNRLADLTRWRTGARA